MDEDEEKHTGVWVGRLYGAQVPGALEEAWKLRAKDEVWSFGGGCMGAALLDVSKCYERVAHTLAGNRATETGCNPRVTNLVMSMYHGTRRLLVDGATSQHLLGNSGLMAGCSFARDFLKAFLSPLTEGARGAQIRDYVDDW